MPGSARLLLPALLASAATVAAGGPSCDAPLKCCIRGKSIAKLYNTTASAADCCAACNAREGCGAYCFYHLKGSPTCNLLPLSDPESGPYQCTGTGECVSGATFQPAPPPPPAPKGAKNLLYFMVDDLRTALGYRHPHMALTPHLDQLASEGATFTHAYCNHAVCAPSRDSFMVRV
jgi:hypothetical protein